MTVIYGLLYAAYFMLLGSGMRVMFNWVSGQHVLIHKKTEFFAQSFFQGIFLHVVLFNILQFFPLAHSWILILTGSLVSACLLVLILAQYHGKMLRFQSIAPTRLSLSLLVLVTAGTCLIYWNGRLLPNIAWDSWMIWEGKAKQWLAQGLNVEISQWQEWIGNPQAVFNVSAHYPDGISLLYFLPKLIFTDSNPVVHVLALVAYALTTLLMISRLAKFNTPGYLQLVFVMVMYSIPLINNHLMIFGYADIWMAMYVLLIMLTLMDYQDEGHQGTGLTIIGYLLLLPMLKLEGWVWLGLFVLAHLLVKAYRSRFRSHLAVVATVAIIVMMITDGIHLSTPLGQLIINSQQLVVFNLLNTPLEFSDIYAALLTGFFWQNNWSFIWLGLPFLLVTFFTQNQNRASQVSHVFMLLALLCFLFLFFFTTASQWARDLTALNRVVLQLTPCYLFLLFKMLSQLRGVADQPDPA
ncbi:hypothetical protein ACFODZ_14635 [Marinicella sediminis]|uniref:Uncharacterized protein n=1 Tax=Marinicella sediminis TaxID=1792834 RepID=A0ABV7JGZ3_9GAMM|nr:hypothetical protein [Marinicella sediminis]